MYKRIQKILDIDYDILINYFLIAYAFTLPISKAGTNTFEILILLSWLFQGNFREKFLLYKQNLLLISFFIFLILHIISIPFASSIEFALDYIAKYRHFLIILPIYSSLRKEYLKHILSAFLLGMFVSELLSYGIFFELITYKNILPSDPSPFMDHVSYSVYLAFTSILLLTRLIDQTENNAAIKIFYAIFFLSSTTNLFINGGRTGQVTFIILIFISVFSSLKCKVSSLAISIGLILGVLFLSYNFSPNFKNRTEQAYIGLEKMIYEDNYKADGFTQRVSLWIVGLDDFQDNFLFGKGIGSDTRDISFYAKNRGFDPIFLSNFGDHHNMFLITALQFGIVGLLSILFIFYSVFTLKFESNVNKILNLTFIVGFFLWSFGNTTFHTMNPMVFFALFAGVFNKISNLEMESTVDPISSCFVCGCHDSQHYSFWEDYEYIQCSQCGLVYVGNMPKEKDIYNAYSGGKLKSIRRIITSPFRKLEQLSGYAQRVPAFKKQLETVLPYLSKSEKPKLLDIGCNKCFLLEAGVQLGFEPYGVELIPELTNQFKRKYKHFASNIYICDFSELDQESHIESFDLITAFDLVEHLRDTRLNFSHIYNLLNSNGVFLFQTPNVNSKEARSLKQGWGALKATEHYHLFNDDNIVNFGKQLGFREVYNITDNSVTNGDMIIVMLK